MQTVDGVTSRPTWDQTNNPMQQQDAVTVCCYGDVLFTKQTKIYGFPPGFLHLNASQT